MPTKINTNGFTLIELTIVVAVLLLIVGIIGGFSAVAAGRSDLRDVSTQARDFVRRAQWQTMHGQDDDDWAVHFETSQVVLYRGTYSAGDSNNFVLDVESPLSVSSISLNGGGSEVTFVDETGDSNTFGTITIQNSTTGQASILTINEVGMIDLD